MSRLSWLLDLLNRPVGSFATISSSELKELESEVAVFCEPLGSIEGGPRGRLTVDIIGDLHPRNNRRRGSATRRLQHRASNSEVTLYVIPDLKCRYMWARPTRCSAWLWRGCSKKRVIGLSDAPARAAKGYLLIESEVFTAAENVRSWCSS